MNNDWPEKATNWFNAPEHVKDVIAENIFQHYLFEYSNYEDTGSWSLDDIRFYMLFDLNQLEKEEEYEKCAILKYTIKEYC